VAILLVVLWAFVTAWVGIWGSSPTYLITLLVAIGAAIGLVLWAVLVGPPRERTGRRRWLSRVGLIVAGVVVIGALVYLRPLSAEPVAIDALEDGDGVTVNVSRSMIRLAPDGDTRTTGLAFYQGAKVDPQAYAHILRPLAEAGFPVVIFKQPYNLAVLDSTAASAVIGDTDDDIDRWVIGGHSLGGAMAASYAEQPRDELYGLLLYAAYPVNDMSQRVDLAVMSVYGTNDDIATPQEIEESAAELPPSTDFVPIEGAIHSYFGDYGPQRGDGNPDVTREEAQREIAAASLRLLEAIDEGPQ
jgi:dienelactone hydrolase